MPRSVANLIVAGVALVALALTLGAWQDARSLAAQDARNRFEVRADDMVESVRARITDYEQVLRGVVGLFAASDTVEREEWLAYYAALRLDQSYPAIRAAGYATWEHGKALTRYVAPADPLNVATLGYDAYAEPVRRAALDLARDTGEATLSARTILRSDPESQPSAFLVLPVYRNGARAASVPERRAALQGFVYIAFRFSDLFRAVLGDAPAVALRLTDTTGPEPLTLYDAGYAPEPGHITKTIMVPMRGRTWRVDMALLPAYARSDRPRLVLAGGLAISLLLAILVWSLLNTRSHARELARDMVEASDALERFRSAIDAHQDAVVMVDEQTMRVVYCNEGAARSLGYRREEIIGQHPALVFADRSTEEMQREYLRLVPGGEAQVYRALQKRKDGSTVPVEVSRQRVRTAGGAYVIGIARDISARLAAEQALRESSERLALALESSGLALFDWDLKSGLVHLGAQWRRILEDESAPVVTPIQKLEALVHADDLPALREEIRKLVSGEIPVYRIQHRVRTGAGGWKWIESVAKVNERDAAGRALRITGTNADITERRAVETMKNDFIASVSHELRTPLTGIVASLALLKEGSAGELPPQAAQFVDMAHGNSERLADLIGDILDLERIESGRLRLEMQAVDVAPLLAQAAELNRAYAERYQAFIEVRADKALPANADPHRLLQVLANLISNAAKFSPVGGRILLYGYREPGCVVVSVSDQGPGIAPEFLVRLFGKFEQADRDKPGTGLGLAISKALVERMGGRIRCESEPGRGATFFVELPAA